MAKKVEKKARKRGSGPPTIEGYAKVVRALTALIVADQMNLYSIGVDVALPRAATLISAAMGNKGLSDVWKKVVNHLAEEEG